MLGVIHEKYGDYENGDIRSDDEYVEPANLNKQPKQAKAQTQGFAEKQFGAPPAPEIGSNDAIANFEIDWTNPVMTVNNIARRQHKDVTWEVDDGVMGDGNAKKFTCVGIFAGEQFVSSGTNKKMAKSACAAEVLKDLGYTPSEGGVACSVSTIQVTPLEKAMEASEKLNIQITKQIFTGQFSAKSNTKCVVKYKIPGDSFFCEVEGLGKDSDGAIHSAAQAFLKAVKDKFGKHWDSKPGQKRKASSDNSSNGEKMIKQE